MENYESAADVTASGADRFSAFVELRKRLTIE